MLREFIVTLDDFGVYEVLNPFLIVFILSFALFSKSEVLSSKKGINAGISIVLGLVVVIPHVMGIGVDVVPWINRIIPTFAILLVASLALILLAGVLGVDDPSKLFGYILGFLIIIEIIVPDTLILAMFAKSGAITLPSWLSFVVADWFLTGIIFLAIFTVVIYFIMKE